MIWSILLTVVGLCVFEIISSIDNAIVNAEVLSTMGQRARRWFMTWGIIFAVFVVRGMLPWAIVWATNPSLGLFGSLTATFSNDPRVMESIEKSAPILMAGGGMFLVLLFFHWLFVEPKEYGLIGEKFINSKAVWFYAVASILLVVTVWSALKIDPMIAFAIVVGSSAFFITHGFKQQAEQSEKQLVKSNVSDVSKIFYLEILDMSFSIDGVLGAFAFTMSVPLILVGNGIGAIVLRKLTLGNIDRIKKYKYLKNGAMYSILVLGIIMLADGFGANVPQWLSPVVTILVVGFFLFKSIKAVDKKSTNSAA